MLPLIIVATNLRNEKSYVHLLFIKNSIFLEQGNSNPQAKLLSFSSQKDTVPEEPEPLDRCICWLTAFLPAIYLYCLMCKLCGPISTIAVNILRELTTGSIHLPESRENLFRTVVIILCDIFLQVPDKRLSSF